jgi:UDP-N-acetylmuramoyl-L-alanyl-D-glutamate--2,6-diaminopimelate ligase
MELIYQMRWSELLARAGLAGQRTSDADPVVHAIVEDSREVMPGSCFVAMRGTKTDGHRFIESAVRAGAVAVVSEQPASLPPGVADLVMPCARGAAGRLAATLYRLDELQRTGRLRVAGITGTNGKSTFCFLLRSILQAASCRTALLGTIEYDLLSRRIEANLTTPAASTLMSYLAEAAQAGATHAAMEVSSIALDQGRCDGIDFAVGVFSNLTGDHLDYHGTMEAYLAAKKRLFDRLSPHATAVTNIDDPAGERMVASTRAEVIRYGIATPAGRMSSRQAAGPRLLADVHEYLASGTCFDLRLIRDKSNAESVRIETALVGRHNVQNCLAAAGAAIGLGIPLEQVAAGLRSVTAVPGRLQRVMAPREFAESATVLVDYAHTDDALANVLSALRPLTRGRLTVLFGCGGDRDRTKRPRMAHVAAQYADRVVVTSDNPRTEEPQAIIRDILAGFTQQEMARVAVEPDRRQAICAAVSSARADDVILLAGKGHENYQIIGQERVPFDDARIAAEVLEKTSFGSVRPERGAA